MPIHSAPARTGFARSVLMAALVLAAHTGVRAAEAQVAVAANFTAPML